MCAHKSSVLYEEVSPNLHEDKSSDLYSVVNEALKNTPSQYAIPQRAPTAAQKELKMEVFAGPKICTKDTENKKNSGISPINESLNFEEENEGRNKRRNQKLPPLCPVKFALAIVFIVMVIVVSMVIALFVQMRTLHEMNRTLQKSVQKLNLDKNEITEQTNVSYLYNLVLSIKNRMDHFNITLENSLELVNDFISAQENTNREVLTRFSTIPDYFYFPSCSHIASLNSSYASGIYIVRSSTGVLWSVYCDVNRTFGGNSIGWTRVAELDVNNCPSGLRRKIISSVNTCVVIEDTAGCTEINYPVYNTQYTQITGQVRAYQVKSSDGFVSHNRSIPRPTNFTDLNNNYLDGVSISTNGQHIWSFAAGCNCRTTNNKPTIIGQDYTCDGVANSISYVGILWASQQCGRNSIWFYKVMYTTNTDIQVRICRDENRSNEDLALKTLELYIQ